MYLQSPFVGIYGCAGEMLFRQALYLQHETQFHHISVGSFVIYCCSCPPPMELVCNATADLPVFISPPLRAQINCNHCYDAAT